MSTYEQRDNSGSLFKNDRREKDSHPNATGKALIGGVEYWVSAWTKKDRNGNPWQSLSFKPVDEARGGNSDGGFGRATPPRRGGSLAHDLDDDIPFAMEWR